jgi:hypothetical protein
MMIKREKYVSHFVVLILENILGSNISRSKNRLVIWRENVRMKFEMHAT